MKFHNKNSLIELGAISENEIKKHLELEKYYGPSRNWNELQNQPRSESILRDIGWSYIRFHSYTGAIGFKNKIFLKKYLTRF